MTHCRSQLLTSVCTFVLYMSREWSALWLPPTEVHAEAESENHAENIGNVFVHRPQEPIPNSWHITRQGYSKDRPADSFFVDHWLGDSFLSCYIWLLTFTFFKTYGLWLILQYFGAVYIFSPAVYINITFAFVSKTLLIFDTRRQQTNVTVGSFHFRRLEFTWATVLMKRQIALK